MPGSEGLLGRSPVLHTGRMCLFESRRRADATQADGPCRVRDLGENISVFCHRERDTDYVRDGWKKPAVIANEPKFRDRMKQSLTPRETASSAAFRWPPRSDGNALKWAILAWVSQQGPVVLSWTEAISRDLGSLRPPRGGFALTQGQTGALALRFDWLLATAMTADFRRPSSKLGGSP